MDETTAGPRYTIMCGWQGEHMVRSGFASSSMTWAEVNEIWQRASLAGLVSDPFFSDGFVYTVVEV